MNRRFVQMGALAAVTVKQCVRNKAFASLIILGSVLFGLSLVMGAMAVGDADRVTMNAGFWILGIFGLLTSILLGVGTVQSEFKTKIVYLFFSRPISRPVYLLGKFTGIFLVTVLVYTILSLFFITTMAIGGSPLTYQVVIAIIAIFFEWALLSGFSLLLSTFVSPFFHTVFMAALYFIGHWSSALYAFSQNTESMELAAFLKILYFLFPNLEALNYRIQALYGSVIETGTLVHSFCVMMSWLLACLAGAILIIDKRRIL